MIVVVPTNDAIPPSAPRTPAVLFQNPMNISAPKVHSETPRNQQAPLTPKTGYIQEMSGPLLMYGMSAWASYSNHKEEEHQDHRRPEHVIVDFAAKNP